MLRGSREQPGPGGGWSKIGTLERRDRRASRRARPVSLGSVSSFEYDGRVGHDKSQISVNKE